MREYLLCLVVAASVTYLATPVARRFATWWGAMAEVRDRDVHDEPTPRLGGLGMAVEPHARSLLDLEGRVAVRWAATRPAS